MFKVWIFRSEIVMNISSNVAYATVHRMILYIASPASGPSEEGAPMLVKDCPERDLDVKRIRSPFRRGGLTLIFGSSRSDAA